MRKKIFIILLFLFIDRFTLILQTVKVITTRPKVKLIIRKRR